MDILSFKPGHDGAVALISDETLIFSLEAEKDSFQRYSECHPTLFLSILERLDKVPEVIAMSGWFKAFQDNTMQPLGAGYFDHEIKNSISHKTRIFGKEVNFFSSSHLRSHILSAYSMSSIPQGQRCYCLVWEGILGSFYEIDENLNITHIKKIVDGPGNKYGFIYSLANPGSKSPFDTAAPGKVMALASFSDRSPYTSEEKELAELLLTYPSTKIIDKNDFKNYSIYNAGVESIEFKNFSGKFSDDIFNLFYNFAKQNLKKKLPLIISGGCGLNCEWNTKWKNSGIFEEVFVPPVPNDSGSAIGTAIDAQLYYTGKLKIDWKVYAGEEFVNDEDIPLEMLEEYDLDNEQIAHYLSHNNVIAWIQGKYEMGPRALGNRSLLASPLDKNMQNKLNKIKQRESYRPIAPICIEEDVSKYFEWQDSSPHMLYFQKVKTNKLPAITHVDGTARVQTVNSEQNEKIYRLLNEFKKITEFSVLCNTSLNFNGKGFINRTSDLLKYSKSQDLNGFVINDKFYKFKIK
jgi:predicted NodU family carbamoyl transferase